MLDSDNNYDKQSMCSDVSVNTDMKVFNGAISLLNQPSGKKKPKVSQSEQKLPKFHMSEKKVNINDIMNKMNGSMAAEVDIYEEDPLSFRMSEIKQEIGVCETLSGIAPEDTGGNGEAHLEDLPEQANNIFWKIKEKKVSDDDLLGLSGSPTERGKLSKMIQSNTASSVSCIVSRVEKGQAILVTTEDQIFTIPTCFLPKLTAAGNTYSITIQETCKASVRDNAMKDLQKKLRENK
jgi:hypothetical protein